MLSRDSVMLNMQRSKAPARAFSRRAKKLIPTPSSDIVYNLLHAGRTQCFVLNLLHAGCAPCIVFFGYSEINL